MRLSKSVGVATAVMLLVADVVVVVAAAVVAAAVDDVDASICGPAKPKAAANCA